MSTFGPSFDEAKDGERVRDQMQVIRDFCLARPWMTLNSLHNALGYPEASISAQLRHLRKERFGAYRVEKRRRTEEGLWEYRVLSPLEPGQLNLFAGFVSVNGGQSAHGRH